MYLRRRFLEEDQESLQDQVGEAGSDGDVVWRDRETLRDHSPEVHCGAVTLDKTHITHCPSVTEGPPLKLEQHQIKTLTNSLIN